MKRLLQLHVSGRVHLEFLVNQSEKSFIGWEVSLNKLIKTATAKKIIAYLDFSNNLFASNTLYMSPSLSWLSDNTDYTFGYDSLPNIKFRNLNLKCFSKNDSSIIYNTSGVYYPTEKVWNGKNGKVNWLRAGIGPKSRYENCLKGWGVPSHHPRNHFYFNQLININQFALSEFVSELSN